ncbi:dihydrofolate reductase [Candidatus Phytoplasma pini]|uniref:dihydrofolate reductase n=1 Tax=Candidatus Phytoplasma pini TaxID=267362 RepID=A0A559KJY2_9MOLU|nr:Dihydrofolate reductase [Candidatus Phytoplasma pini]
MPWNYPEDISFFKKKSLGQNVLMGNKTFYSLKKYYKKKTLPFKKIYVASLEPNIKINQVIIVSNLINFLKSYQSKNEYIMVLGGGQIYHQSLPYANIIYLTHILKRYQGNVFFPRFSYQKYRIHEKKISNELIFVTYIKK